MRRVRQVVDPAPRRQHRRAITAPADQRLSLATVRFCKHLVLSRHSGPARMQDAGAQVSRSRCIFLCMDAPCRLDDKIAVSPGDVNWFTLATKFLGNAVWGAREQKFYRVNADDRPVPAISMPETHRIDILSPLGARKFNGCVSKTTGRARLV